MRVQWTSKHKADDATCAGLKSPVRQRAEQFAGIQLAGCANYRNHGARRLRHELNSPRGHTTSNIQKLEQYSGRIVGRLWLLLLLLGLGRHIHAFHLFARVLHGLNRILKGL